MQGGVLELGAADFTRSLGANAGSINMNGTGGGFSAYGGTRTVAIGGNTNSIAWGATSFVASGQPLLFGSLTADSLLVYSNGLSLGTSGNNTRDITVRDNIATNTDVARIANIITGSSGNTLRKTGDGVLELTGANTYSGPTTNAAGTLLINGSLSAGGGAVVSLSGATLGGSGVINRSVTVLGGGTLSPGNSAGLITVQNLTLASNATFAVELGLTYDQVLVTGSSASISNSILALSWTTAPTGGDKFLILSNDTPSTVFGEFAGWSNLSTQFVSGVGFEINYFAGNGNDVLLTVIPEPSALALVGAGLLLLVATQRRRR